MADPRVVLIVNPQSQNGALGRRWPELSSAIRRELGAFEDVRTQSPGDATRLAREALRGGADVVVAIGGDGTINEVANGFFDGDERVAPKAALGIIPFGTGGDFRKTAHIPRDHTEAAHVIARGKRRTIDVGKVEFVDRAGDPKSRYFINIASFGISGVVDDLVNTSSKMLGGRLSFIIATVRAGMRYKNQRVQLTFDDDPGSVVDATINNVAVANGRYFGGGMYIAPRAELDDGEFDVVAVGDLGLRDFAIHGPKLYRGTHLSHDKISWRRARTVTATSLHGDEVLLDVDGEQPGRLPATFTVVPRALDLMVPL